MLCVDRGTFVVCQRFLSPCSFLSLLQSPQTVLGFEASKAGGICNYAREPLQEPLIHSDRVNELNSKVSYGGELMENNSCEKGIGRRTFLKAVGATAFGIGALGLPCKPWKANPAHAETMAESYDRCRIVVFGSDSLRIDYARTLRNEGAPGLGSLSEPLCVTCGGFSVTQPGWAEIWTGLPSYKTACYANHEYQEIPTEYHIMKRLADIYYRQDFYPVWITGKGKNIAGREGCPHFVLREMIIRNGHQGVYRGDKPRQNEEVFELARDALQEAALHDHFCCFVHFRDPDKTGHYVVKNSLPDDFETYMNAAWEVDQYIWELMALSPPDTKVIYCSDHGFDFVSQGDTRNAHKYSPFGMLATNFHTISRPTVDRMAVGRLIYKASGGNPDFCTHEGKPYSMYGEDLV
jgi:hypothetical protein